MVQRTMPRRPVSTARTMRQSMRRAAGSVRWAVDAAKHLLAALPASLLAILVAFHGWLLYTSVASGRLFEADVATRWAAGLLLSGAFAGLWRLGVPLVRGRQALVLWSLVVVLHAHAVASTPATLDADSPATGVVAALVVQVGGPLAAALGLLLLALARHTSTHQPSPRPVARITAETLAHLRDGGLCLWSPRPPPVLA